LLALFPTGKETEKNESADIIFMRMATALLKKMRAFQLLNGANDLIQDMGFWVNVGH